ncbi:hypothetical protein FIBSPDRAFT_853236 [Athelia psychrophila]|uniref:Uncharacterized protein n=1 Tax=Athelia psychrophila TaxID=1759441 RepID=A0A166R8E7_9AGAM|nr:hypothetical protein FIBSPDRAFT_874132 [Fibularhizoctonia sp. CBS 109695]KZP28014.1 hypothetical protein FIBSPDRAFT_853236 [Fibularhizoctonia sp. CBS 109695]
MQHHRAENGRRPRVLPGSAALLYWADIVCGAILYHPKRTNGRHIASAMHKFGLFGS